MLADTTNHLQQGDDRQQSDNTVLLGHDATSPGNSIADVSKECSSFRMLELCNL